MTPSPLSRTRPTDKEHDRREPTPAPTVLARVEGHAILTDTTIPLSPVESERERRLGEYLDHFQSVFQRTDQFERFGLYLRGLLEPGDRKNVEAIATAAGEQVRGKSDLTQALQHFISQSPWEAAKLMVAYRKILSKRPADPEAVWVVHDGVFPKKGRHSVGVQRQFARSVGRKLNCQMAVVVGQVGPSGYYPLASRLYLPAYWLQEHQEIAEKMIPEEYRKPTSKYEIALSLIDELRAEQPRVPGIIAEEGYATLPGFIDGLNDRRLGLLDGRAELVAEAHRLFDGLRLDLGLDHFEGRTWQGWHHHVSLVFAAYGFLAFDGV
uniref:IS701 family transposase n=1 Tax=Zavarzinella formosa TaxID=360055 RepID=UPI0012FCC74D|nr:transposase [Zavarzinella formosa]